MTVRSAQLFARLLGSTSEVTLYTCPASTRTLLKGLTVHATQTLDLNVSLVPTGFSTRVHVYRVITPSGRTNEQFELFVVMNAGDLLVAQSTIANALHLTGGGAELAL